MARCIKLTPALTQAIANAVRLGLPLAVAAEHAGLSQSVIWEWVQRGEGRHPTRKATVALVEFAEAIKKARADDQARRIARIEQAAKGEAIVHRRTTTKPDGTVLAEERYAEPQWTADAWHLERSDPEHWSRYRGELLDLRKKYDRLEAEVAEYRRAAGLEQ